MLYNKYVMSEILPEGFEASPSELLAQNIGLCYKAARTMFKGDQDSRGINDKIVATTWFLVLRHGTFLEFDDYVQDAAEAFLKNADRYDPAKGSASHFFMTNMLAGIQRAVANSGTGRRIPISAAREFPAQEMIDVEYVPDAEGYGFAEESDGYGMSLIPEEDIQALPSNDIIDEAVDDYYFDLETQMCNPAAILGILLHSLSEKSRRELESYFIDGLTQQEIGEDQGVTSGTISYRIQQSLKRMQVLAKEFGFDSPF